MKDPYAQAAFGERQTWLVRANRRNTVYTPQFFVNGAELRLWQGSLQSQVQREITLPAAWNRARLDVVAFVQDERTGSGACIYQEKR